MFALAENLRAAMKTGISQRCHGAFSSRQPLEGDRIRLAGDLSVPTRPMHATVEPSDPIDGLAPRSPLKETETLPPLI